MKKLVSLLLALMLVMLCTASLAEDYPEVVEGIDFGGATLYINPYWEQPPRSEEPTEEQELQYAYEDWLMEKFNVKVEYAKLGDWGDAQVEEVQNIVSTGDTSALRVILMPPGFVGTPMSQGWFADWANNDLIDLKDTELWNTGIVDFMTMGDKVLGVATGNPEPRQCLFFNKKVLEDAGIDWNTIYDMQRDGTWTWDAFEKLCAQLTKDTDANGVNDIYGLTGNNNDLWMAAVFGNNGSFFDFDENNKLVVTAGSDNVTEALTWASNLWNNYARGPLEGENWDYFKEVFKSGNCGFYIYQTYGGYNENAELADMEDPWGCVAFPKAPKGDDYYYVISDNVAVVPNIYDEQTTKNIEYFYSLFMSTAPGIDKDVAWIGQKYNICSDERAVDETYAMLREPQHGKGDKSLYLGDNNKILGSNTYGNYLWGMTWNTPTALLEGIKPTWDALCAVFNGDMTQDDFNKMLEEKAAAEAAAAEAAAAEAAAEETAEEAPAAE